MHVVVIIRGPILERPGSASTCITDEFGCVPAADVGEAADVADDLAELVRPLPRDGERTDPTAAHPAIAAFGIVRDVHAELLVHGAGSPSGELRVVAAERVDRSCDSPRSRVVEIPGLYFGSTKTLIVTGTLALIRLSKTIGTRKSRFFQ
jgi:hypothetical protein